MEDDKRLVRAIREYLQIPIGVAPDEELLEYSEGKFYRKCIEFGLARDDFVAAVKDAALDDWKWIAKLFNRR